MSYEPTGPRLLTEAEHEEAREAHRRRLSASMKTCPTCGREESRTTEFVGDFCSTACQISMTVFKRGRLAPRVRETKTFDVTGEIGPSWWECLVAVFWRPARRQTWRVSLTMNAECGTIIDIETVRVGRPGA